MTEGQVREQAMHYHAGAWERVTSPFVKLGDVTEINPRLPKNTDETQDVSFLAMASVLETGRLVNQETRVLSQTRKGFTYFKRNDVLLAKITPCFENGKAAFTDGLEHEIGFGSTEFHVLRAKEGQADGKYIFYLVWNDIFRFHGQHSMKGAAGQKRVSVNFLKQFKIPLPPLEEQKKIASILDAADALRQKDQQLIEHYTRLSQSLFLEMFGDPVTNPMGWEVHHFGDCLNDIVGGKSVKGEERPINNTEQAVIKISAVTSGVFNPNEYKVVDETDLPEQLIHPQLGDLLFSRANTREMVGATCVVDEDYSNLFLPDKIWRLDLKPEKASNWYIKFLLGHEGFRGNLRKVATGTSGSMLNISKAKLKLLKTPLPAIDLQNQFAERIKAIEAQKQQAQANLEKSNALFNSLLQRAFKGELTQSEAA